MYIVNGKQYQCHFLEEFGINEIDLAESIKDYVFPKSHYEHQLNKLHITWTNDDQKNRINIINNKEKLDARNKHIIFLGYDNRIHNKFWFCLTTSKTSSHEYKRRIFMYEKRKNIKIWAKTDRINSWSFNDEKLFKSRYNNFSKLVKWNNQYKDKIIKSFTKKDIKRLAKFTNLSVWTDELKRRNKNN